MNENTTANEVIALDQEHDIITIYGIRYSLSLFRTLALGPVGGRFEIVDRGNGLVALRSIHGESANEE